MASCKNVASTKYLFTSRYIRHIFIAGDGNTISRVNWFWFEIGREVVPNRAGPPALPSIAVRAWPYRQRRKKRNVNLKYIFFGNNKNKNNSRVV